MPLRLETMVLTKEEAAIIRVALVALRGRPDILSDEGLALMPKLEEKAKRTLNKFPKEAAR